MSSSDRRTEELLDRLVLEVKALVLLHGSDAELRARLERKLADSQDESVRRFVGALQKGAKPHTTRLMTMAVGEMVLASLLVVAGAVVLVPTVLGINTPAGLVQYFSERVYGSIGASPLSQYVSFMEFAVGALLILSAFYTLRQAAAHLKEIGLSIKTGEA